ncbi:hypothetical protein Tco_0229372, partial [Tanacetum coccineum]
LAEFWYLAKTLENSKVSFSVPTGGIYGEVGVNTFRNVIGAYYLPRSREYVAPPSINIVRPWFETIGYGETVPVKGTGTDIKKRTKIKTKPDKTKHGNGMSARIRVQRCPRILLGQPVTHLNEPGQPIIILAHIKIKINEE